VAGRSQVAPVDFTLDQAIRNNASLTTEKLETRRAADDLAANRYWRSLSTQSSH
jgi:hypothetical protein